MFYPVLMSGPASEKIFIKAVAYSMIKSLLHWHDMTKQLSPKLNRVCKAWTFVLHLSHWAVVAADPTMKPFVNPMSTIRTMSLVHEFVFNYLRKREDSCFDLLRNKHGIAYIVGVMSTLYSSSEELELVLLQYIQRFIAIVSTEGFFREPKNVWCIIQDKMLKFISQADDTQENNMGEIVRKLKERLYHMQ